MGERKGKRKRERCEDAKEVTASQTGLGFTAGSTDYCEGEVAEFGFEEDVAPSGGRRKKTLREKKKKAKPGTFETMGLSSEVLRGIKRKGYRLPTPIQRKAMPLILAGHDVVGMARTGSGKTAAFVIPLLHKLGSHSPKGGARALLLAPTRELVLQTHKVVKELGRYMDLRTAVLLGGDSMEAQFAELASFPDILLAAPGRLMHHLKEIEGMSLRSIEYCVFDEADRLFEMGFAEQLRAILGKLGEARQTLLFSATLPSSLAEFARAGLKEPEFVRLDADTKLSPDLSLAFFTVRPEDKVAGLLWLLQELVPASQPTVVFAATKHHVDFLTALLQREGVRASGVYGSMDQAARKISIGKFRAGKSSVLVVTDVAARGLDIPLLDNVVHYDFPAKPKLFVHRSGRAARNGRRGASYSLLTKEEMPYLLDLHLFLSRPLGPAPVQSLDAAAAQAACLPPDSSLYGCFPQVALEEAGERVRAVLEGDSSLQSQVRSVTNAYNLYRKTRPPAAAESVKRARGLPPDGVHPLLAQAVPSQALAGLDAQEGVAGICAKLRMYRPLHTVMEAEMAPSSSAPGGSAIALKGPGLEAMRQKRRQHERIILASRHAQENEEAVAALALSGNGRGEDGEGPRALLPHQRAVLLAAVGAVRLGDPEPQSRFRDPDFFVSETRDDAAAEQGFSVSGGNPTLDSAVLDLLADDEEGIANQARNWHWDKRKKRYIMLQPGEKVAGGKRVRSESGAKAVTGTSSGLYNKWMKSSQRKVALPGDLELPSAGGLPSDLSKRFVRGGRGWVNPEKQHRATASGPRELKTPDQVRRERKVRERKAEKERQRLARKKSEGFKPNARPKVGFGKKGAQKPSIKAGFKKAGKPRR